MNRLQQKAFNAPIWRLQRQGLHSSSTPRIVPQSRIQAHLASTFSRQSRRPRESLLYRPAAPIIGLSSVRSFSLWPSKKETPSAIQEPAASTTAEASISTNSAPDVSSVPVDFAASSNSSIADIAASQPALESAASAAMQIGDLKAAGLMNYTPVGALEWILEHLYVYSSMPWWLTIATTTVVIRLCIFPFMVKILGNTARLANIQPEVSALMAQITEAKKAGDNVMMMKKTAKVQELFKENNCNPIKSVALPLIQVPVFISFFFALRDIAAVGIPSFSTEGLFWFQNLSVADPLHILPFISTGLMMANLELGAETGTPIDPKMKNLMRVVTLVALPITWNFASGIFVYWVTTNMITITQNLLLRQPAVRKTLGLPPVRKPPPVDPNAPKAPGFMESFRASFDGATRNAQAQAQAQAQAPRPPTVQDLMARQKAREAMIREYRAPEPVSAPTVASTMQAATSPAAGDGSARPKRERRSEGKKQRRR